MRRSVAAQPPILQPPVAGCEANRVSVGIGISVAIVGLLGLPGLELANSAPSLPVGLTPGEDYRLAFLTSTYTAATSPSSGFYNNFVQNLANTNSLLPSTTWRALVSTATKSASTNIDCSPSCGSIPIFNLDGTEVASSANNLFGASDGAMITPIDSFQDGSLANLDCCQYVWTGSNDDGTASTGSGPVGSTGGTAELGSSSFGYVDGEISDDTTATYQLWAISGELVYEPTGVPEPTTLALLASGGLAAGLLRRLRRRRRPD